MKTVKQQERQRNRDRELAKKGPRLALKLPNREDCAQLARILLSGIPLDEGLAFIDPAYAALDQIEDETKRSAKKRSAAKRWTNSPILLAEQSKLQQADWPDLEKDVRIRLAYDKHLAELAYLLYSHSYITAHAVDEGKMDSAREAIAKYLSISTTDPEAPWMRAIREIYETHTMDGRPLGEVGEETKKKHQSKGDES